MSKKHVVVEYLSNVNTVIKQPLQQAHRIKFASVDVSPNFVVFGATSGGIYIFNRFPCKFIKLLPNKEGGVTNVLICPDESSIAISTVKGFIVIIENSFLDNGVKYHTFSEHDGRNVTALKWNSNELYVGDDLGKITVILLPSKTSKSIFNIPTATLMTLDSTIVQLDAFSKYLLASTRTKTYLCDTEKEHYRQIGKKPRDGHYGAVFYTNNRRLLKEKSTDLESYENVRIYCARPGCRIWEAKFDGSVVCTHQFKESLNLNNSRVIHVNDDEGSVLNVTESDGRPTSGFSFGRIFVFVNFILSFQEDSLYIFDICSGRVLFWTDYFINIKDIKVLDNILYVWCGKNYLRTLYLSDIEDFVNVTLSKKQYTLCSELCLNYKEEVMDLLHNGRLDKIKILKEKVHNKQTLEDLKDILNYIYIEKINVQKKRNGIFVVNKPQAELKLTDSLVLNGEMSENEDLKGSLEILRSQYQINKINNTVDTPKYLSLICDLEKFITLYEDFVRFMIDEGKEDETVVRTWFNYSVLRYISNNYTMGVTQYFHNKKTMCFIKDAFVFINTSETSHSCSCSYPLPTAKNQKCHFYKIGCEILNNYFNSKEILDNIPRMFQYFLSNCTDFNLALLIQYGDENIILKQLKNFTYDTWDEACKFLLKLRKNICLNCDNNFICDKKDTLNWTDFGKMMLKSLNGTSTINLLLRYSTEIEPGELNDDFYQLCILTSALQGDMSVSKEKTLKLIENMENSSNKDNVLDVVGTFLWKKSNGSSMSNGVASSQYVCTICDIPKMPILDEFIRLKCGHVCHKVCTTGLSQCKKCIQTLSE